jgi:hypothetical protein
MTLFAHTSHTLKPLDVKCFKPSEATFKKKRNNRMTQSDMHNELDKTRLTRWVDKALRQLLSQKDIYNGLKAIWI